MNFKEHKIFHINEYILERNQKHTENVEILSYIEHFFRVRNKELTFALLELVLLNENGIGETYVFAKDKFNAEKFHERYVSLINEFKEKYDGGVSTYNDWYRKCTWILSQEQTSNCQNKHSSIYKGTDFSWVGKFEGRDLKKYGKKNEPLEIKLIETYLNEYAERIGDLEFNQHPFYFIVVQPISKSFNREHLYDEQAIPYGNLYLHFATNHSLNEVEIEDFVRGFMVLWYKKYGGHDLHLALDKIMQPIISDVNVRFFLPEDLGSHANEIGTMFMRYFNKEANLSKFESRINTFKEKLRSIIDKPSSYHYPEIREFKKAPSYTDLFESFSEESFENFLFKRSLVVFFLVCREFSVKQIRIILGIKERKENADSASDYAYINQSCHIYLNPALSESKLKTDLKNNNPKLSAFEKSIIKEFCLSQKS